MPSKNLYDSQKMVYGRGSNTTLRCRVNKPTLELKTVALSRRRVWHTHTNFTPYDVCNKRTKSSMIEPTCNGEKVTRSLLPRWRMTMSGRRDETTGKPSCFSCCSSTDTVPTGNYRRGKVKIHMKIVRMSRNELTQTSNERMP